MKDFKLMHYIICILIAAFVHIIYEAIIIPEALNLINIASISNIRGAASTVVEITVQPSSNDVVPVRDQIVEIDVANSIITVEEDTFVGGSAEAGVGYTTNTSY